MIDYDNQIYKNIRYVEYPAIQDLYALKQEVNARTNISKFNNDLINEVLDSLSEGALSSTAEYIEDDFNRDLQVAYEYWLHLIEFIKINSEDIGNI